MSLKATLVKIYGALRTTPHGYLDAVDQGCAKGWAIDPRQWGPAQLDIFLDGRLFQTVIANRLRQDLVTAGQGNGCCAFEAPLPGDAMDRKPHTIEARFSGTDIVLKGTPWTGVIEPPRRLLSTRLPLTSTSNGLSPAPEVIEARKHLLSDSPFNGLSVVIPTHNRAEIMERNLRVCLECARGLEVEFLVIDDSSDDDTPQRLAALEREFSNVRSQRVPHGGQGQARNIGVPLAKHELVLFLGDDIQPACQDFFLHHIRAHQWMPSPSAAVLGKIVWPDQPDDNVNFVMTHIQGMGQEQFGFFHLMPYTWLDWRFFYTSNVSFKRSVVSDWNSKGFSREFTLYGYEDAEFAYRLNKSRKDGFRILYCPAAIVTHHHHYSLEQFIDRQINCGLMARTLVRLHPEIAGEVGVTKIEKLLATPTKGGANLVDEYLSMIEGVKSWAKILDHHYNLGSQNWHTEFLRAVFELCYLQGCIMANDDPSANYAAAYRHLIELFHERMSTTFAYEAFGKLVSTNVV
jgi:glycosyltransferase involved in cell wall biosynthesis